MRFFICYFLISFIFVFDLFSQKNIFSSYKLGDIIPLDAYYHKDNGKDLPYVQPDIIGLDFLNDGLCTWTNIEGLTTVWDYKTNIYKFNCLNENRITNNSIFNSKFNALFHNGFSEFASINVHNILKGCEPIAILKSDLPPTYTFRTICINPKGDQVVAIFDSVFHEWRYNGLSWSYRKIKTTEKPFFEIKFLNNESVLVSCNDGKILIYDSKTFKIKKKIEAFDSTHTASIISVSENSKRFVTTTGSNVIKIFDESQISFSVETNVEIINDIRWLDDDIIVVAGEGKAVELWSVIDGVNKKLLQSIVYRSEIKKEDDWDISKAGQKGIDGFIKKVAVSKDKKTILLGTNLGEILKLFR